MNKIDNAKIQNSIPIENVRSVLDYIVGNYTTNRKIHGISLSKNNEVEFTVLFGPHNTTRRWEHNNKIWILNYKDSIFNIFCSAKGTSYELVTDDITNKEDICMSFIQEIQKLLIDNKK